MYVGRALQRKNDGEIGMARTILVVDDNQDALEAIAMIAAHCGHSVAKAVSTREALDFLDERTDIDLVISDIRMPGVDGFDFRRVVRHRFRNLPVILVTGESISEDDVVPRDAPILRKPISIDDLQAAVTNALDGAGRNAPAQKKSGQ